MGMLGFMKAIPAPWQNQGKTGMGIGAAPSKLESVLDWDWVSWSIKGLQESGAGEAVDNNSTLGIPDFPAFSRPGICSKAAAPGGQGTEFPG